MINSPYRLNLMLMKCQHGIVTIILRFIIESYNRNENLENVEWR